MRVPFFLKTRKQVLQVRSEINKIIYKSNFFLKYVLLTVQIDSVLTEYNSHEMYFIIKVFFKLYKIKHLSAIIIYTSLLINK